MPRGSPRTNLAPLDDTWHALLILHPDWCYVAGSAEKLRRMQEALNETSHALNAERARSSSLEVELSVHESKSRALSDELDHVQEEAARERQAQKAALTAERMRVSAITEELQQARHLPMSPHISPHLPMSPHPVTFR